MDRGEGARPAYGFAASGRLVPKPFLPPKSDGVKVHHSISELAQVPGPVVLAIGVFDGLHLGHRAVLERAQKEARRIGGTAVPLSFDPHPARVLRPENAPLMLTAAEHKMRLLEAMGFSHTLLLPFNLTVAATSADDFIRSLAQTARPLAAICVGHQWSFGKGRQGNLESLAKLGAQMGFVEIGVPEILFEGEAVSSTRIRNAVTQGDFVQASRLLGRAYSVLGEVQRGRALGRTLGFPTANLGLFNEQLPPHGVYAVRATGAVGTEPLPGVANLGTRPTVESSSVQPTLEVHLLDYSGDLYGKILEVEFVAPLRGEQKFASLDLLRQQIHLDTLRAKEVLGLTTSLPLAGSQNSVQQRKEPSK